MAGTPRDTSPDAAARHRAVLERLGPEGRVRMAIELSEAVRSLHLAGLRARNPSWSERDAVRHFIANCHGVALHELP